MPVRVVGGRDAVKNNSSLFASFGKRCLIVSSKRAAKVSGAIDDVAEALEKENIAYTCFDEIGQNPKVSSCFEAGKKARESAAEFIIGIGGGSALDASKAVAIFSANGDLSPSDIYKRDYKNAPLPVVLVGTTAGTGSEVSAVSVLTNDETGMKKSISGDDCYAKIAFADSKYTFSASYDVTVSTALDAFSHAVEGYFTKKLTETEEMFALKAIPMIWEGLKFLHEKKELPDEKLRDKLYYGSLYAGVVLNKCGTCFPHPLGYVLTENFGIPHGKACTVFMGHFLDRAKIFEKEKYETFLKILGEDETELKKII